MSHCRVSLRSTRPTFTSMLNKSEGTLEITREHRMFAFMRSFAILVDGKKWGSIEDNDVKYISLSPGLHSAMVRFGLWRKTSPVEVYIETDKTTKLSLGYRKPKKLIASDLFYIILVIVGSIIGNGSFIGIGVVGAMVNRKFGEIYLYDEQAVSQVERSETRRFVK
jgi:hypothetical protein